MTVPHRHAQILVTEKLFDREDIHAALNKIRSKVMSQVMHPQIFNACTVTRPPECHGYLVR